MICHRLLDHTKRIFPIHYLTMFTVYTQTVRYPPRFKVTKSLLFGSRLHTGRVVIYIWFLGQSFKTTSIRGFRDSFIIVTTSGAYPVILSLRVKLTKHQKQSFNQRMTRRLEKTGGGYGRGSINSYIMFMFIVEGNHPIKKGTVLHLKNPLNISPQSFLVLIFTQTYTYLSSNCRIITSSTLATWKIAKIPNKIGRHTKIHLKVC